MIPTKYDNSHNIDMAAAEQRFNRSQRANLDFYQNVVGAVGRAVISTHAFRYFCVGKVQAQKKGDLIFESFQWQETTPINFRALNC